MKKTLFWSILVVAVLTLSACSTAAEPTTEGSTSPQLGATVQTSPSAPENLPPQEDSFSPIILVDNEDICVKVTDVENDPIWGYTLKVYLENNTDKSLMFTVDDVSINGFMCDPYWAESVAAGKKSNSSIYWFDSTLKDNGIATVEEITMTLQVYDSNDILADDIYRENHTIQP